MPEKINLIVSLELRIKHFINKAASEVSAGITNTNALNMEFYLGKYAAYMEILKGLDRERYIKYMAENEPLCEQLVERISKVYG